MPALQIELSEELYQRFLTAIEPLDRNSFAITALEEALDRRRGVVKEQASPRRGRPPGLTREKRTINLEPRLWLWLESQARPGETFNDTCNRVVDETMALFAKK